MDAEAMLQAAIKAGTHFNILGDVRLTNGVVVADTDVTRSCIFCAHKTRGRLVLATRRGEIRRADVVCDGCNAVLVQIPSNGLLERILVSQAAAADQGNYRPVEQAIEQAIRAQAAPKSPVLATSARTAAQIIGDIDELLGSDEA